MSCAEWRFDVTARRRYSRSQPRAADRLYTGHPNTCRIFAVRDRHARSDNLPGVRDPNQYQSGYEVDGTSPARIVSADRTFVHSSNSEGLDKQIHPGEVFVGAQAVVLAGDGARPTIAVSYIRRLYESPAPELDMGTFRESGTILLSNDMAGFHFDTNFIVTEETQGGVRRAQYAQTLSVSHPLKKFTVSGEVWHFTQPFFASNAVGTLWSLSYPIRRILSMEGSIMVSRVLRRAGRSLSGSHICCRTGSGADIEQMRESARLSYT